MWLNKHMAQTIFFLPVHIPKKPTWNVINRTDLLLYQMCGSVFIFTRFRGELAKLLLEKLYVLFSIHRIESH